MVQKDNRGNLSVLPNAKSRGDVLTRMVMVVWLWVVLMAPLGAQTPADSDIEDPTMRTVVDSMNAHQAQWNLFMLYTMNTDTPGYVETGGFNHSKNGRIAIKHFYRWRTAGPPVETRGPLDFFVDAFGRGFFSIMIPSGVAFTRDGRFMLDSNRRLVTLAGGFPVLGERGEITIPPGREIAVSKAGLLYVDGDPIDRLKIAVFKSQAALQTVNGSVFVIEGNPEFDTETVYSVRQGFIEQSNVVKALIGDLTMASRVYEATAKAGKSINKLNTSIVQMGGQ